MIMGKDNERLPYWMERQQRKLGIRHPDGKKTVKKPASKSASQKAKQKEKQDRKRALTPWFETQLLQAPKKCENCGADLRQSMAINPRTIICHIVPKNNDYGCPSVATHLLNRWYGCQKCHGIYDTGGEKAAEMPVIPICKSRLGKFIDQIPEKERRHIPNFLIP